ncbi:hypothetical protein [Prevotella dentasini]|uniref:hypothetical protein n=1 Tax=Prevotella dentasini TaxID=589537 RepID=UPI00046A8899|nr:hypothetical protein [Prevotella dentasini]
MKNNEQTIKAIVSELKDELRVTDLAKNDRVLETMDKLEQKIEIHEKTKRGLANLWLLLLIIFAVLITGNILLLDRNDALESKLELLEYRDSLFKKFMEPDSNSFITYRTINGKPVTYHQLEKEKDSLEEKSSNIENLKEHYRIQLGLVTRNYPISFQKKGNVYMISAPQIDSALQLLPVYRDMIKYDAKDQVWTISRYK